MKRHFSKVAKSFPALYTQQKHPGMGKRKYINQILHYYNCCGEMAKKGTKINKTIGVRDKM